MYELMCWCWSSKPHHRPSFSMIRQLAHHPCFTRLHHAMSVQCRGQVVTSAVKRYYRIIGTNNNERQRHKSLNITPGYSFKKHKPITDTYSLQHLTGKDKVDTSTRCNCNHITHKVFRIQLFFCNTL